MVLGQPARGQARLGGGGGGVGGAVVVHVERVELDEDLDGRATRPAGQAEALDLRVGLVVAAQRQRRGVAGQHRHRRAVGADEAVAGDGAQAEQVVDGAGRGRQGGVQAGQERHGRSPPAGRPGLLATESRWW